MDGACRGTVRGGGRVKIAVLSFAHEKAAVYARLLRDMPGVDLVTADPDAPEDPTRGQAVARQFGVPYAGGWDEVFALRPRAVVVTSEIARRRELVERAAEAGAHVLCEHPPATEEADAREMVRVCEDAGVRLTFASPTCFGPAFGAVRRKLADGEAIGTLMTIQGAYNSPRPHLPHPRRTTREPVDGGALAANAAVLLDMVDAVLGGEPARSRCTHRRTASSVENRASRARRSSPCAMRAGRSRPSTAAGACPRTGRRRVDRP